MDTKNFKSITFGVASTLQWKVANLYEPVVTPNFWVAELTHGNETIYLLCSRKGDWAVSSFFSPEVCELWFEDCPQISTVLEALYKIRVHSKSELNEAFVPSADMSPKDVKYWKPETMGQGLFNWRD